MLRVVAISGLLVLLIACAGEESAQPENAQIVGGEPGITAENAQQGSDDTADNRSREGIPIEVVREMSRRYSAPWEQEEEKIAEAGRLVNWLDRKNIPLESIKQIINWSQFTLEFSPLTDPCVRSQSCSHEGLLAGYYMRMASAILDSKNDGRRTINPAPMVGDGMLVLDTIDLLHQYYLDSETWSDAEFKRVEALKAEIEKIERVPGFISQSLDNGILRICQFNTDPITNEVNGPCTDIWIQ